MSAQQPAPPAPSTPGGNTRTFIFWAFLISLGLHFLAIPFVHLRAQEQEKEKDQIVSVSKKIKVVVPTPPPPTPTPPPPTPPPKQTPPPVKETNPPPQPKLKLNVPKSTSKDGPSTENKYVPPPKGSEDAVPNGTADTGKVVSASTAPPATPAPTPPPTPTPTPKPECANPNADASIKGTAVEPDYPDIARQQGATGTTQVKVTLDATGNVVGAEVYKSAGNPALDRAAVAAARETSYVPEIVNCVKTAGSYLFRADFTGN
jgi:TonB family protein